MRFQALEKLINLHDGYRRRFKIDDLDVLLLQDNGVVHIVHSRCPHQEQSLELADIDEGMIICPRHQFGFHLEDGRQDGGFCASLQVWQPVYEGPQIGVMVQQE